MPNVSGSDLSEITGYLGDQSSLESWRSEAACNDDYAEWTWFFPDQANQLVGALGVRRARLYCADCPVRLSCLAAALADGSSGIWGGTTDEMRAEVAHLDSLPERIRTLDAWFFRIATRGPWRIIARADFRGLGDGERKHRDPIRPTEVSRNGSHEPARSQGSRAG